MRLGRWMLVVWIVGCAPAQAGDAGLDAGADGALADGGLDALDGRDAPIPGRPDGGGDGGRGDAGADRGPGSCAAPLDFDALATLDIDGSRWLTIDLASRGDHHVASCSPSATGPDVILALTAPATGRLQLSTEGDADTILAVRAACEGLDERACNDDALVSSGPAALGLEVALGEVLFVVIDTFEEAAARAPFVLRARILPTRPLGAPCDPTGTLDGCVAGTHCAGTDGVCVAAAEVGCERPIELGPLFAPPRDGVQRSVLYRGTVDGAPDILQPTCQPRTSPEVVHRLVMPHRGRIRADLRGGAIGLLAVRTTCTEAVSELACELRGVLLPERLGIIEAGTELFFVVEPWSDGQATYELELSLDRVVGEGEACALGGRATDLCAPEYVCRAEGDARACRTVVCGDGLIESGEVCDRGPDVPSDGCGPDCRYDDACGDPIDLLAVGAVAGDVVAFEDSTVGADDSFRGTCSRVTGGADRVFVYVPPRTGTVMFTTDHPATSFDTLLYARPDCAGTAELGCQDDIGGGNLRSTLTVPATMGTPIYLVLDGYNLSARGTFHLTATLL